MNEDRSCSVIYQKMVQISPLDSHHWLDPLEISSNGEKQKQTEQRKKKPKTTSSHLIFASPSTYYHYYKI